MKTLYGLLPLVLVIAMHATTRGESPPPSPQHAQKIADDPTEKGSVDSLERSASFWMDQKLRISKEILTGLALADFRRRFLFPVLDSVPGEKAFWEELVETVAQDGCQVIYMDFSYQPLTLSFHGQALPFYNPMAPVQASCAHPFLTHPTNLLDALNQLPQDAVVIGRWGAPPVAWINQIRSFFDAVVVITSAQSASRSEVEKNNRIYQQVLGDVHDTILVEEKPAGPLLSIVQTLEDSFVGSQQEEENTGVHLPMDGSGVMVYTPPSHQIEDRNRNRNRNPADPGVHAR